jgi:hypothetical protein
MARIKKYADNLTQNLTYFQTFVTDTNPNSDYFRITEFKESFTGGKNGFLIEGSEYLKESTDIKIEILDVEGNPIYFEPGNGVPEYYEGLSKVIAVYIYEDTPIGNAKITILGELKTYLDGDGIAQPIPSEWAGIYNVKWEREFKVNRLLSNEDKVRFYVRPEVTISEIVKPIFSNVVAPKTQSGIINGIAQVPVAGTSLTNYTSPRTYILETVGNSFWTGSIVGTYLDTNLLVSDATSPLGSAAPLIPYKPLVTQVINSREILVQPPYTEYGLVANTENATYTGIFNYTEGVDNLKTALTGSFAKITLADLTTFVGDCARVKIFRKSTADLSDFQFVQEIQLESNEILVDLASTTKNQENYGLFDNINFKEYWVTSSNDLDASFEQSFLFDSIKLNSTSGVNKFFTTKSLNINEGIEYSLNFNVRKEAIGNRSNYIEAYLSGSKQTIVNGSPATLQVKQSIVRLDTQNSLLEKQIITENIKAEEINNARLYFDIKGFDWHIADVSLKASQETAFSPDEITFIQSVPRSLPVETFIYRFEFYDINNNYIPVLVEETKTFDGGNLQRIQKGLVFSPRSLTFQFDSGSNPVPPTVVGFTVTKNLLTGSVNYTSQSFDFFGDELFASDYTASFTGQRYPGLLSDITSDAPTMTVGNFTGSRGDKLVQIVKITGEVEGYTDTVIFTKVLDGFGGVNYLIRPYRGTQIRNSSTSSLEIQAIRIDGVNDIQLSSLTKPEKGWPDKQLHIISRSADGAEKFVNLSYASSSGYVRGLITGSLGSGEINYNAIFNRDSIDFRRTIYLISSASAASSPAYIASASVVASQILEDLQDGLDSGVVIYNADSFTINPRTDKLFKPVFGFATASFAKRGTAAAEIDAVTASFQVYPSMSINRDWVPEYWMYYMTQSLDPTITVVAKDDNKILIPSQKPEGVESFYVRSPLNQTKNLTLTFTYTEPWTSASVSIDKTFTIVPEGKQGDESIVFEVSPISVVLGANSRGIVNDYRPSITDIRLKQGSKYLAFSSSAHVLDNLNTHGTFYIATASIIDTNVTAGNVQFTSSFLVPYTASLIVSASSNMTDLSGSIEYPLIIHPYFTSSIYSASVFVNYTKILEGAPPIQIIISPTSVALTADEVGYITPGGYSAANTTIQVKDGDDFLKLTTTESFANADTRKGTYTINSIAANAIQVTKIASSSLSGLTGTVTYNRFDYPFVSASALYTLQVYPYALGAGHQPTSSIFTRTQTFTKNVTPPKARSVDFKASAYTVNYDRNGRVSLASQSPIILSATAFNTTASADKVYIVISEIAQDGSESGESAPIPGAGNPVTFTLPDVNFEDVAPGSIKTFKVKITDGNPYTSPTVNPYRAEAQLTISGVKAGADSYKLVASNESTAITADLWGPTIFSNTGMKITTFNGTQQLINETSALPQANLFDENLDFEGNPIGVLGYSSASIVYKDNWIGLTGGTPPKLTALSNPASIGDIISWTTPATNTSGKIVYRVDFEGDSSTTDPLVRPLARQTQFVTQSISVQFTPPPPYDVKMTNENSSAVYKVAGTLSFAGTGTQIRVYRGGTELVNTNYNPLVPGPDLDAYGNYGYKDKCRISIDSYSSGIITLAGTLTGGNPVPGAPATMGDIIGWATPASNPSAQIVYEINCEGRQTFYKTQSLSIQYEGNVGPGLVMRGEWDATKDYYGSVENINDRLDVVTYQATSDDTKYYAAISGSGPNTWVNPTTSTFYRGVSPPAGFTFNVLAQAPTPSTTQVPPVAYWRYLGTQDFFVAAKLAIFEKSYVKNSINVGTKDTSGDFANIVINGGRPDPYIALGQVGSTAGTAGTSGTSTTGSGVIGYDKPGIFLGMYENGSFGTTGRFSIKTTSTSGKGMSWDGDVLTIIGAIRQIQPGVSEGSLRGAWTSGDTYYTNDIVSYGGQSWRCTSAQAQNYQNIATNDTNALTGYPGSGPWAIAASAGTSGTSGALGATGGPGPGVVYRGPWAQFESDGTTAKQYFREPASPAAATRRDVVKGSDGAYYLCKVNHTTAVGSGGVSTKPITGVDYATYWESFGATFSSVATDVLLSQDATITRALVMGSDDDGIGIIRSVDATAFNAGAGFFMDKTGRARFGDPTGNQIKFDGTNFEITGSINATDGQIGDWVIDATTRALRDTDSQIILDPNIPEIQFYTGSGAGRVKKVSISPVKALSSPSATPIILYLTGSYTLPTPSITTTAGYTTQEVKYSAYTTSGSVSDGVNNLGRYNVTELGFVQVTANIPTFEVETPPNSISHTTTFPSYFPQYSEQKHGGYSSPQTAVAYLYLEAVKVSDDSVIGQSYIGNSSSTGEYDEGNYYIEDFYSVTGDTLIINEFGESIYAKDVIVGQIITAWDWHSSFKKYKIENIKTRTVNKIFKVSAGGKEVKVSETHGFWLDGNAEIKVSDLIPGESKINIKDGNTIKLVIVDNVEIIESVQTVYTFVVPVAHNYISNDIISHNPSYWALTPANTISAVSYPFTGGEITTNIFLSATGLIRFRYAFYFYAAAGTAVSLGATVDSYSTSVSNWTFNAFSTMTALGDTMSILAPANFVEINAGGLQVISDSDKYVRIPRRATGAAVGDLLKVFGGNIRTDNILPNDTGRTVGSSYEKYDYMYSAHYYGTPYVAATNGYTYLTNGIILQWGYQAYTTTATPVVFPITFPNAVYSVHVTTNRLNSGANGYNHAGSLTTAGFSAVFDAVGGWWSAIGA